MSNFVSSKLLNLKMHNYHKIKMMDNMKLILDEEQLCDVVLIAGIDGKRIPAHRLIVSAASEYFKAMFISVAMKETTKQKEITIADIDGEILEILVNHCYNGDLNIRVDNVKKILSAAHLMKFTAIVDKCAEVLKTQLNPFNCLGIKFIAERLNCCNDLETQAHKFICENFNRVAKCEEFLQLSVDQLDSLLSRDDLNVQQEEDIIDSLLSWVRHDEDNRKKNIPKLLQNVRMSLMNPEFIAEHLKSMCKTNECIELYVEALGRKGIADACSTTDSKRMKPRYLSGGYLLTHNFKGEFEKYCPQLKQWMPMREITVNGRGFDIAVWNEKLLTVGGFWNNSYMNTVKYWDEKFKMWKDLSPLNTPRYNVCLTVFGESLYAVGGYNYNGWMDTVERLDSLTGSWHTVTTMPITLLDPKVAIYDGCMYLEGWHKSSNGHLLKYEPNTKLWTDLGETSEHPNSLLVTNDDLYGIRKREIQRYNKRANTWTTCTNNCPHIKTACTFNNRLLVIAEENSNLFLKEYKFSDDTWIDLAPLSIKDVLNCIYIPLAIIHNE